VGRARRPVRALGFDRGRRRRVSIGRRGRRAARAAQAREGRQPLLRRGQSGSEGDTWCRGRPPLHSSRRRERTLATTLPLVSPAVLPACPLPSYMAMICSAMSSTSACVTLNASNHGPPPECAGRACCVPPSLLKCLDARKTAAAATHRGGYCGGGRAKEVLARSSRSGMGRSPTHRAGVRRLPAAQWLCAGCR